MSCQNHGIICFTSGNTHFSMLTSSLLHPKSDPLELQIAPSATTGTASSPSVANRGAHKTVAGLVFGAQNGQQCLHAYMLTCSHAYMTTCLHAYMPTCFAYMLTCLQVPLASLSLKHTNHSFSLLTCLQGPLTEPSNTQNIHFPRKTGTYPEVRLSGRTLTGPQNRICSHPRCSRDASGASISGT